jgi:hypothetical protein
VFARGEGRIQLLPWATVSGTVLVGDHPEPGQTVRIQTKMRKGPEPLSYFIDVECDSDGNFKYSQVPPGEFDIGRIVKSWGGMSGLNYYKTYEIQSGDQLDIEVGGEGCTLVGQCRWERADTHAASLILHTAAPEGSDIKRITYFADLDEEGHFRIENVLPGDYELSISIKEPDDESRKGIPFSGKLVGSWAVEVVVPQLPDGVKYLDAPVDVGVFDLNLGEEGRLVVGQCKWEGDEKQSTSLSLSQTNLKSGAVKRSYNASVGETGAFSIEHVKPGQYELNIRVYTRRDTNSFGQQIGELKVEIEVPELTDGEKPDMPVDLGELKIEITAPETEI